jgi:outer membrane protein assembly factor BamB
MSRSPGTSAIRAGARRRRPQPVADGAHRSAGRFWVGSVDGHAYRFDPPTAASSDPVPGPQRRSLLRDRVWYFGEGTRRALWLSTPDELVALDPDTGTVVERIPRSDRMPIGATAAMRTSLVDSDGVLWFGGGGAGLIRYEQGKGVTAILSHEPGDPNR